MSDLRELLYEPWLPQEVEGPGFVGGPVLPPLATRMPEAVPAGLEWCSWSARIVGVKDSTLDPCWMLHRKECSTDTAELLFIGNAVKVLAPTLRERNLPMPTSLQSQVAALHRLADERDAAKETK